MKQHPIICSLCNVVIEYSGEAPRPLDAHFCDACEASHKHDDLLAYTLRRASRIHHETETRKTYRRRIKKEYRRT